MNIIAIIRQTSADSQPKQDLAAVEAALRYKRQSGGFVTALCLGTEAAERVNSLCATKLYRKMVALGPSYKTRIKTSDVVQSAGEGVEQIQSFFELFLPQLFYAILAPITLFVAIAPINVPAAAVMLVCAPFIIIVTGIVSMTAARAFKKYWVRYTDMGAAFLDNLQGLETLKNFDADERAAIEMDKKAERLPRHDHARAADPAALADRHGHSGRTAVLRPASVWRYGNTRILAMLLPMVRPAGRQSHWPHICLVCLPTRHTACTISSRSGWATRCLLPVCCSLCCCPPNSLFPCVSLARSSTWR